MEKARRIPFEFQDLSQLPKTIKIIDDMQNSLSESELRVAYAALLVSSLDSRYNDSVHPYFSSLLKCLTAQDLRLLEKIYKYSILYDELEDEYFSFKPCKNVFPKDAAQAQKNHLEQIISHHKFEGNIYEVLLDGGDPYHHTDSDDIERILWFEKVKHSNGKGYLVSISMEVWIEYLTPLTLLKSIGLVWQNKWGHSWLEPYATFRSDEYKKIMSEQFSLTSSRKKKIDWSDYSDGSNIQLTQVGYNLCKIIFG